jgi:hypothetical protein
MPKTEFDIVIRSYDEAIHHIQKNGMPNFISFDHDLGVNTNGKIAKSGYDLAKWLVDMAIDDEIIFPADFHFQVHSVNPVGKKNIECLLNNFLNFINKKGVSNVSS